MLSLIFLWIYKYFDPGFDIPQLHLRIGDLLQFHQRFGDIPIVDAVQQAQLLLDNGAQVVHQFPVQHNQDRVFVGHLLFVFHQDLNQPAVLRRVPHPDLNV